MPRPHHHPTPTRSAAKRLLAALALAALLLPAAQGCKSDYQTAPPPAPGSVYNGPDYLRGTVGSLVRVEGNEPMLVSGFGLVVNLANTGSPEVPQYLRQRLLNQVRRQNLLDRPDLRGVTAERFLLREDNCIVRVFGEVPPGATPGTTFDLFVFALDEDLSTTSLAAGLLMPVDLGVNGANPQSLSVTRRATGDGPIFANPIEAATGPVSDFQRQAVIPNGGQVTTVRNIRLVLNQASYAQAASIADRINSTLFLGPSERGRTANARTDQIIDLQVPQRYADNPQEFVNLALFTFLQSDIAFLQAKQADLLRRLRANPTTELAEQCEYAFRSMGKTSLQVLRGAYDDPEPAVRQMALRAGVGLDDDAAIAPLVAQANAGDAVSRVDAAEVLASVPRNRDAANALVTLLNDNELDVRLAAYEAMARVGHPLLDRTGVYGETALKYVIDRVPSDRPMIYVSQEKAPRIAVFGNDITLDPPLQASLWNNRLMLRAETPSLPVTRELFDREVLVRAPKAAPPIEVFFRPRPGERPQTYAIRPTVVNLATLMGHKPSARRPQDGLNLSYAQVVEALYRLQQQGRINAPMELNINPLVEMVSRQQRGEPTELRPETNQPSPGIGQPGSLEDVESLDDLDALGGQ